jgi:hypothetical protein
MHAFAATDSARLLPVELHKGAFKSLKTLWRTQKCALGRPPSSMRRPRPSTATRRPAAAGLDGLENRARGVSAGRATVGQRHKPIEP